MKLFCLKHNGVKKELVNQQGRHKGCKPLVYTPDNPHFVQTAIEIINNSIVVQVYPSRSEPHLPKIFIIPFCSFCFLSLDKPGNGHP